MLDQYVPEGTLGKIWKIFNTVIEVILLLCGLSSVLFLGAMFINVILRYVFTNPVFWFDEAIVALLVWYSALGTVACYWTNEHAVINFFIKFFGRPLKVFFMFMPHVLVFITSFVFVIGGAKLFALQCKQLPQGGLPFSRAYYNALPMIVMGILLIICSAYRIVEYIHTPKDVFLQRFQKLQDEGGMIIE